MSSIFKATHITSDKLFAQPSAYGFGAIPITTGLNAFRFRSRLESSSSFLLPNEPTALRHCGTKLHNLDLILLVLEYLNDARVIGVVYLCMCVQGHFGVAISARNGPKGAFWGHLIGTAVLFFF
jgi:hypothetical protein